MYNPSQEILDKYADVLVNFAVNGCKGVKKGEVVLLQVPECAKPMLITLRRVLLKKGAYPITQYLPDEMSGEFYKLATKKHLTFFPDKYLKGVIDQIDHSITIIAETNMKELEGIDPKKIMLHRKTFKPYMDWRESKENGGKYTWVLALYGTEAMAKEAKLNLKEYWEQIIKACYLDKKNPVKKWKEIKNEIERVKSRLNKIKIDKIHVKAKGTDLTVGIGKNRRWRGGDGRNIPSFEVFISPDCRRTEGRVKFTEPLYIHGNLVKGVSLEFKKGKVVKVVAEKGEKFLKEMIAVKGANMVGEFSLTDSRLSRITKFMAETLFDENVGGKFGNMHLALGKAYKDCYPGDILSIKEGQWEKIGYNDSVIHTDIVSTLPKEVTAYLIDGSSKTIYKNGKFLV